MHCTIRPSTFVLLSCFKIKTSTNFSTDVQRILQDSSTREQLPRKDVDAVDGDANHH